MENLKLFLEVTLFISIVLLIYLIKKYKILSYGMGSFLDKSESEYKKRKKEKEKLRLIEGNFKETNFIDKIDILLERSGVKNKIKFLNTDIYIILNLLLVLVGLGIGVYVFKYWLVGVIISILLVMFLYLVMVFLESSNYKKIDSQCISFLDLMQNFSTTEDDIVQIMKSTSQYVKEPLKHYIEDFCNEVEEVGSSILPFRRLENKIPNQELSNFIRQIEICSRHEANYSEVIEESRNGIVEDLNGKGDRKAIRDKNTLQKVLAVILGTLCIWLYSTMINNFYEILRESVVGSCILLFLLLVLIAMVWSSIAPNRD